MRLGRGFKDSKLAGNRSGIENEMAADGFVVRGHGRPRVERELLLVGQGANAEDTLRYYGAFLTKSSIGPGGFEPPLTDPKSPAERSYLQHFHCE